LRALRRSSLLPKKRLTGPVGDYRRPPESAAHHPSSPRWRRTAHSVLSFCPPREYPSQSSHQSKSTLTSEFQPASGIWPPRRDRQWVADAQSARARLAGRETWERHNTANGAVPATISTEACPLLIRCSTASLASSPAPLKATLVFWKQVRAQRTPRYHTTAWFTRAPWASTVP
jgi:hypothetical protein